MTYTAATRDRYRLAVWTSTATVAAGAIAATGWVAGTAAHDQARSDAAQQVEQDARASAEYAAWQATYGSGAVAHKPQKVQKLQQVVRQRPRRIRVSTRYITAISTPGAVSTSSSPSQQTSVSSTTTTTPATPATHTPTTQAPTPQTPPPPPPPPPPTPTSGS